MKYPKGIITWKGRLSYRLFRELYIFETGKNRVMGRFTGWINEFAWIIVAMTIYLTHEQIPFNYIVLFIIEGLIGVYLCGRIYYHLKLDLVENLVCSERNPYLVDIKREVEKR